MTNIKTIDGGKSEKKESMCPYCGIVPTSKHPDYTCPRLAGASWGGDGAAVEFIDPEKWMVIKEYLESD